MFGARVCLLLVSLFIWVWICFIKVLVGSVTCSRYFALGMMTVLMMCEHILPGMCFLRRIDSVEVISFDA